MTRGRPRKYLTPCKVSANAEAWKVGMVRKLGKSLGDLLNNAMDMAIMDAIQTGNPALSTEDILTFKKLVGWQIDDMVSERHEEEEYGKREEQQQESGHEGQDRQVPREQEETVNPDPDGPPEIPFEEALDILDEDLAPLTDTAVYTYYPSLLSSYRGDEYATIRALKNIDRHIRESGKVNLDRYIQITETTFKPLEAWVKLVYYRNTKQEVYPDDE